MRTDEEKWRCKGSHTSTASGSNRLVRLQTWKKGDGLVHCSVENSAVLCENHCESHANFVWRRRRKKNILAVWQLSGSVLLRCFIVPLSVLFIMKNPQRCMCMSWSLPSITEQKVSPHRIPTCMQYWLKNHWPDQALFKHSLHIYCISNSPILCDNHIQLLSDLCACIQMVSQRKP